MAGRKGSTFPTVIPTPTMFVFGLDTGEVIPALQNVSFLVSNFIDLGITSLNSDTATAQTLTGGDGIDITDSTPDHSFAVDSTVARNTDTLAFFSATTSAELAGVISDETGTGLLVFNDSPVLITPALGTPTIASFLNANHDHSDSAGGGQLLSTSTLSDTANIAYLNTANVYTGGGTQDFGTSDVIVNTNTFFVDASANNVGIRRIDPQSPLDVNGIIFSNSYQSPFGGFGRLQNLVLYSEEFDNAAWIKPFGATVIANNAIAPNGELTADTLDWTTGTNDLGFRQINLNLIIGNTYTISFWAQFISGNNPDLSFDISDGTIVTVTIDSSTFQHYSVTVIDGSGLGFVDINNFGSNTGIFNIWGFQIVDGSDVLPYTKTTDTVVSATFGGTLRGNLSVISDNADTTSIATLATTGTNAGTISTFVGDQDPDGIITGDGGDEYHRDSGATSGTYESKETTTGINWFKRSVNASSYIEIHNSEEFEALAVDGVITITEDTTIAILANITTFSVFNVIGGDFLLTGNMSSTATITYSGTNTFFTMTGADHDIRLKDRLRLIASSTGTWFNYSALDATGIVGMSDITFAGGAMGSITNGTLLLLQPSFVLYTSPFILTDAALLATDIIAFNGGRLLQFESNDSESNIFSNITKFTGFSLTDSPIRVDPFVAAGSALEISINSTGDTTISIFDTSDGTTGSYTAVEDNSIASTSITSVTDNGGVAVFNHTGTSPELGSTVVISGFTTNTDYNGTFIVSSVSVGIFECESQGIAIAFGSDEATGSFTMTGITVTSTAHGLSQGQTLLLDATLSTQYDNGYKIYNIQTNSFDVNTTFGTTQVGTWDTAGIAQDNTSIVVNLALENKDSKSVAFGFTNANTTLTTVTDGTYAAIDVTGFSEETVTEKFKLINSVDGIFELTALQDFAGFLSGSLSAVKTGSTENYRFTMSTNGAPPVFATANYVPMEVKTTKVNIALGFSVELSQGDTIQIMVAGDGTSNNITITDLVFAIN